MTLASLQGKFIVLDGPDGAGKTTQLDLLEKFFTSAGLSVMRAVDPGGTQTGQKIREILLHSKELDLQPMCETFLFMASRAQLISEIVKPAISAGKIVLCDRFISSTLAYQGALGVDKQMIIDLGDRAVEKCWPDVTVCLDVPVETGMQRVGDQKDRMESRSEDYHNKVRQAFADLGTQSNPYPGKVCHVPATGNIQLVHKTIIKTIGSLEL